MEPPPNTKKRPMDEHAEPEDAESSKHPKLGAEVERPSGAERVREKRDDEVMGEVEKLLTCSICYEIMHRPIILLNCLHTFCGACFHTHTKLTPTPDNLNPDLGPGPGDADGGGLWGDGRPSKKMTCPTCRTNAKTLKKAWMLEGVIKSFLESYPHKKRPETELEELDGIWPGVDKPGTNTYTGAAMGTGAAPAAPAEVEEESDDDDDDDGGAGNADDDDDDHSEEEDYESRIWLPCPSCPSHPHHPSSDPDHEDRRPVPFTCPAPIDRNLRIEIEANPEVEGHGVCVQCERVVPLHGRDPVLEGERVERTAAATAAAAAEADAEEDDDDDDDMEIITEKTQGEGSTTPAGSPPVGGDHVAALAGNMEYREQQAQEDSIMEDSSEEYHTATSTSTPASPNADTHHPAATNPTLTSWYTHAERCKACGDVYCDAYYGTHPSRECLLPLSRSVPPTQSLSSFVNMASGFGNSIERGLCLEFVMGRREWDSVGELWRGLLRFAMESQLSVGYNGAVAAPAAATTNRQGMMVRYVGQNVGEKDWVCKACIGEMFCAWVSRWWVYQIRKEGSGVKEEVRRRTACEGGIRCERQGDVVHCREFEHLRG
ncbi:hypothetical protein SAICODRAFT_144836 [Saitoella complicata NRRL Y-17804]|uniref:RING-type domain-containing protein n=1 Tax=Saitoella complicata (strain BCRC 22490 / CBS 7301 / JCM 7358 / NBRC 10748 / NRRL Y-17804) TaxID=698492 RepID=A0A0E9NNJ4_SAICN|nr:uncharacterized protein SAICODRAFT_144836 [Saitoella complicata NRRL Y-17804]ODQ51821.1 hypothetical protein SAICODRAFT_144836 [Saitoella complicata NRRL Y-17804]GAO51368.1 hypothetical protein G7K_5470-t1 [Saitoella complicata NRRL Y-17804]